MTRIKLFREFTLEPRAGAKVNEFFKNQPTEINNSELKDKFKKFIVDYSHLTNIESNIEDWTDGQLITQMKSYSDAAKYGGSENERAKKLYQELFKNKKSETRGL